MRPRVLPIEPRSADKCMAPSTERLRTLWAQRLTQGGLRIVWSEHTSGSEEYSTLVCSENSPSYRFVLRKGTTSRRIRACTQPMCLANHCRALWTNGFLPPSHTCILRFEHPSPVMRALPDNSRRSNVVSSQRSNAQALSPRPDHGESQQADK